MKLLICSDIHGDLESAKRVLEVFSKESCDKLVILGDLLYHGPRNNLPGSYNPKAVITLLNENKERIIAVRGNCDTEVDQMVLDFPILADYSYLYIDGLSLFLTHGHHFTKDAPPKLNHGDILLHGHTHVLACEPFGSANLYLNPGSVSIPKGDFPASYIVYENRRFTAKDFSGNVLFEKQL